METEAARLGEGWYMNSDVPIAEDNLQEFGNTLRAMQRLHGSWQKVRSWQKVSSWQSRSWLIPSNFAPHALFWTPSGPQGAPRPVGRNRRTKPRSWGTF
jgi:hypothetical protein